MDFAKLLAGAKLPERMVPICLRGDLAAEVEQLDAELTELLKRPATSLAGSGSSALVARIEQLQAEMREHTYPMRLRAMPRHAWRELMAAHPPREVDGEVLAEDRLAGVNRETFLEPMLRVSIVDPVLSDDEFASLTQRLTDQQYETLLRAAWDLNQGEIDVPFSRAALLALRAISPD